MFADEPASGVGPEFGILFPKHEVAAPMWGRVRGIGQHAAFAKLANGNSGSAFVFPARNDSATRARLNAVES